MLVRLISIAYLMFQTAVIACDNNIDNIDLSKLDTVSLNLFSQYQKVADQIASAEARLEQVGSEVDFCLNRVNWVNEMLAKNASTLYEAETASLRLSLKIDEKHLQTVKVLELKNLSEVKKDHLLTALGNGCGVKFSARLFLREKELKLKICEIALNQTNKEKEFLDRWWLSFSNSGMSESQKSSWKAEMVRSQSRLLSLKKRCEEAGKRFSEAQKLVDQFPH